MKIMRDEPWNDKNFVDDWVHEARSRLRKAAANAMYWELNNYALNAWRPMEIVPPREMLLLCACEEGLKLMRVTSAGDWRTDVGQPHRPPRCWMPAPMMPPPL